MRTAVHSRRTAETSVEVRLDLDGTGRYEVSTGVGFFDHMMEQLSRHSLIDLTLRCKGDLHIDSHHTVEDCGLAVGSALAQALGDRRGIERFGHAGAGRGPAARLLSTVATFLPDLEHGVRHRLTP